MPASTGVFVAAEIERKTNGERVPLWTPSRPFLSSVEIEVGLSQNGLIRATLDAPYRDGIALLEDGDLIVQSNVLRVRMGYSSGVATPWYTGLMGFPGVEIGSDGVTVTLEAHGGAALAMVRETQGTLQGTREDIVRQIALRHEWGVDINDAQDLQDIVERSGAGRSVWMVLSALLDEVGYDYYMGVADDGRQTLVVLRRATWLSPSSRRTFVLFGTVDLKRNQYPLLDFSADASALFLWRGGAGVATSVINDDGVEQVVVADDAGTQVPSVGGDDTTAQVVEDQAAVAPGLVPGLSIDDVAAPMRVVPPPNDAQIAAKAQAEYDRRQIDGFTAQGSSILVPLMRPGETVGVFGVSSLYSGMYGVYEVRHRVDSGGGETSFTMKRNAVPSGYGTRAAISPANNQIDPVDLNENGI